MGLHHAPEKFLRIAKARKLPFCDEPTGKTVGGSDRDHLSLGVGKLLDLTARRNNKSGSDCMTDVRRGLRFTRCNLMRALGFHQRHVSRSRRNNKARLKFPDIFVHAFRINFNDSEIKFGQRLNQMIDRRRVGINIKIRSERIDQTDRHARFCTCVSCCGKHKDRRKDKSFYGF